MKDINEMENDPIMAKGFVLTAYRNLPNYEVGTGTDVATDDAVTNEKGANWSKYATGSWTVQSWDPTGRWNNDLSSMQYLYIFLNSNISNIGFLKNANENKLMQRRLTGEAYGLLATHAYYLLRAHAGFGAKVLCYGAAFVGTVVSAAVLLPWVLEFSVYLPSKILAWQLPDMRRVVPGLTWTRRLQVPAL